MPLEIRELHIRVNVGDAAGGQPTGAGAAAPKGGAGQGEGEDLVARCVDAVLRILDDRKER
jgi:hypothetical protein